MGIRHAVKRSIALTSAYYVLDDMAQRIRLALGDLSTRSGARHAGLDLKRSLAYIERVHADYCAYAGVAHFAGTVAEIGPGDNFGVALLLLGNGASAVHTLDRYRPLRDAGRQRAIYRALAEQHHLAHLFDGEPSEAAIRGLVQHTGEPAEIFFRRSRLRFDAILSRAVIEHLYDPLAALDDMAAALRPRGVLVHRIDLRDHGIFEGHHPLAFLTIPEPLYRLMTRASGRPNRVPFPAYEAWLARSGLEGALKITRLAGVEGEVGPALWEELAAESRARALETVRAIRPRLAAPFRGLPDEALAASGCLLVARKP